MSAATLLVRLYPASLRDRWGAGLAEEASVGGWRRLPNLLIGLLDMWLHPVVWPADSAAQRHRRAAALAFVLGLAGWLVGHLAVQVSLVPDRVTHSWILDGSDVLVLAGLVLVVPLPRLSPAVVLRLAGQVIRKLAVPVVLGVVVALRANLTVGVPSGLRVPLLAGWWLALVLGAVQVCHVVAVLDADVLVPPHRLRLRLGIGVLTTGLALAGAIVLLSTLSGAQLLPSAVVGGVLLVLTVACGWTLRDLYGVPVAD